MKSLYNNVRGTTDFSGQETSLFNWIINKAKESFGLFNYEEIILPILEEEGVFVRGVGSTSDIVEKQMFKLSARGDSESSKNVVLRPEGTAQVVRYYLQNYFYKNQAVDKFFYVGPMFRGERPQRGRLRQFHHIGAEVFGSESVYLDVEVIQLVISILDSVGVKERKLKINTLGCAKDKENFSKNLKGSLKKNIQELCDDCQRRLENNPLRVLDCKREQCKNIVKKLEIKDDHLCGKCKDEFSQVQTFLKERVIQYVYDPYLVRGLDYYTNTVFEVVSSALGAQDAIGAGGRYNNLVSSLGGPEIPAIGFALGVERIMLVLEDKKVFKNTKEIFVAVQEQKYIKQASKILNNLRQAGVAANIDYSGKSLKAQLRLAQKRDVNYVIILAEDEWQRGNVILKDMKASQQEEIKLDDLIRKITNYQ